MRFANYLSGSRNENNIGDSMISLALDYIYYKMGVDADDVVRLRIADLPFYSGEHVILPVVRTLADYPEISKAFSEHITPVFINFVLYGPLHKSDIPYLKLYEPVGCRDEYTVLELRRNGINAYLFGCITACFPHMPHHILSDTAHRKVFLVDVQPELEAFIPDRIKKNAVYLSHFISGNLPYDPILDAKRVYKRYKEEASLVITSRLHAASPCMAAGIPVILAKNEYSHRFTWIDRFIPVYDKFQYSQIDWNPSGAEYEEHKARMLKLATARIRQAYETDLNIKMINDFYNQREKRNFVTPLSKTVPLIESKKKKTDRFSYSIWGITSIGESVYGFMSDNYPQAELTHVYDKFRRMEFCGRVSEAIDVISQRKDEFLIACPLTEAIYGQMQAFLNSINKAPDTYVIAHWSP